MLWTVIITGSLNGLVLFCTLSSIVVCNERGRSAAAGHVASVAADTKSTSS